MRRWVSLGGWCGPSLMLAKLGMHEPGTSLPFDYVRSTLDGINCLLDNDFSSGFFPEPINSAQLAADAAAVPEYAMDAVGIWLLFRSQHVCFAHCDLNNPLVQEQFRGRIAAFRELLSPPSGGGGAASGRHGLTFVRTVVAEDPTDEMEAFPSFAARVRERTQGAVPFRSVLIVHDQAEATQPLFALEDPAGGGRSPCVVWNLKRDEAKAAASLFDQCHDGYQSIIVGMSKEMRWKSLEGTLPTWAEFASERRRKSGGRVFRPYTGLSRIEGVPAVRGTCTGFGSAATATAAAGGTRVCCPVCGSTDGHAADPVAFDTGRGWSEEEEEEALMAYALAGSGGDLVAATEAIALQQKRGAHETLLKLRQLIGIDDDEDNDAGAGAATGGL